MDYLLTHQASLSSCLPRACLVHGVCTCYLLILAGLAVIWVLFDLRLALDDGWFELRSPHAPPLWSHVL